jgi:sensor histidine kinase YesM
LRTRRLYLFKIVNGNKQLIISDNGIGFDLKSENFWSTSKFTDNIDSHGIGLYLVYSHITNLEAK